MQLTSGALNAFASVLRGTSSTEQPDFRHFERMQDPLAEKLSADAKTSRAVACVRIPTKYPGTRAGASTLARRPACGVCVVMRGSLSVFLQEIRISYRYELEKPRRNPQTPQPSRRAGDGPLRHLVVPVVVAVVELPPVDDASE